MKSRVIKSLMGIVGAGVILSGELIGHSNGFIIGRLDVQNKLNDSNFGNHTHNLNYTDLSGASDGPDEFDVTYPGFPTPSPLDTHSKIISSVGSNEFETDVRPLSSLSNTPSATYELSLVSKNGSDIVASNLENSLFFEIIDDTGFSSNPIYLQQVDSTGYPMNQVYDVRDIISNQAGSLNLDPLNGTFQSEVPYAHFDLLFTSPEFKADANNDNMVTITDLTILAGQWQQTGCNYDNKWCAVGDFSTGPDFNFDGQVSISDLTILAGDWQQTYSSPVVGAARAYTPEPSSSFLLGAGFAGLGLYELTRRKPKK